MDRLLWCLKNSCDNQCRGGFSPPCDNQRRGGFSPPAFVIEAIGRGKPAPGGENPPRAGKTRPYSGSARETPEEHNARRFQEDDDVENRRLIFDVVEVVLMFFARVLERSAVGVTDLRPSGQSRFDQMTLGVIGDLLFKLFDEDLAFGARSDQSHLAAHDVDQLRQFIDPQFANPSADAGHARIATGGPNRAVRFGVHPHRTKFDDPKYSVVKSDPLLQIEDGAP